MSHTMSRSPSDDRPRFLSEAECHDVAQRLARYARGGGDVEVVIASTWTGNVRWARNVISSSGEDRDNNVLVERILRGRSHRGRLVINDVTNEALMAATRRAERVAHEYGNYPDGNYPDAGEPVTAPSLFFDTTYQLDAGRRAEAARHLAQSAADAGMLSAGYIEVSAVSMAYITSWGYARYYQYTWAQYSVTVRDPKGAGSGWAGVDWPDWNRIDGPALSAIALDKCLKSRNPVAVEPGRYTTVLEPQAVCDFIGPMMFADAINREANESSHGPFHRQGSREPYDGDMKDLGIARLGEKVIDERITISADPMDPDLGFPPFNKLHYCSDTSEFYHPATWIEHGVLKNLSYDREYARALLGRTTGLPNSGAFRMSGGTTSVDEMIASTKRGLLVTRFDRVEGPVGAAQMCRGYTRDGLWFIENGKISKPVKNMLFIESIMSALNNVEQLGPPQRAFHPVRGMKFMRWYTNPQPVIVPPLKIRDFSFTALSDAI